MSITKFKLFYNSTVGQDDEVKSFLFASDGTALTHTGGALNVNISSPLSIDVDLDHTTGDSVQIGDGTDVLAINGDGSINAVVSATNLDIRDLAFATDKVDVSGSSNVAVVDGGGSLTVDAVDLDIRDLAFATDSVDVSGSSVSITGSVAVTATDLDIRDLSAATDSVSAWTKDGAGNSIESIGGNLSVADCVQFGSVLAPNLVTANSAVTVAADTAQKQLEIQNWSNHDLFYGPTGTTTVANGLRIPKYSIKNINISGAVDLICANSIALGDVRVGRLVAS